MAAPSILRSPKTLAGTLAVLLLAIEPNLHAATAAGAGQVDLSFDSGRGPVTFRPGRGGRLLLQADGRVVIGGHFNAVGLNFVPPIIRFNADGSLDESFDASVLTPPQFDFAGSTDMNPLALDSSGRILVSGQFLDPDGSTRYFLRLNANGSLDSTFYPRLENSSTTGTVNQAKVLSNGKILIAGEFSSVNGISRYGLARLNADGSL